MPHARFRQRRKIGRLSRDGLKPRLEGERQRSQRTMQIESGKRPPFFGRQSETPSMPVNSGCSGASHLEDDARAELRHHRGIARILDRVPKPFIAVQQDGLARDRLLAEPARLREFPVDESRPAPISVPIPAPSSPRRNCRPGAAPETGSSDSRRHSGSSAMARSISAKASSMRRSANSEVLRSFSAEGKSGLSASALSNQASASSWRSSFCRRKPDILDDFRIVRGELVGLRALASASSKRRIGHWQRLMKLNAPAWSGIDLARRDKARERFLVSFRLEIEQPARVRRLAMVGLDLQRLVEAQERFIRALLLLQHLAHPVPDVGARRDRGSLRGRTHLIASSRRPCCCSNSAILSQTSIWSGLSISARS